MSVAIACKIMIFDHKVVSADVYKSMHVIVTLIECQGHRVSQKLKEKRQIL